MAAAVRGGHPELLQWARAQNPDQRPLSNPPPHTGTPPPSPCAAHERAHEPAARRTRAGHERAHEPAARRTLAGHERGARARCARPPLCWKAAPLLEPVQAVALPAGLCHCARCPRAGLGAPPSHRRADGAPAQDGARVGWPWRPHTRRAARAAAAPGPSRAAGWCDSTSSRPLLQVAARCRRHSAALSAMTRTRRGSLSCSAAAKHASNSRSDASRTSSSCSAPARRAERTTSGAPPVALHRLARAP